MRLDCRSVLVAATLLVLVAPRKGSADEAPGAVWAETSGVSTAFGITNGSLGGAFSQEVRVRIRFNDHVGMMVKLLTLHRLEGDYRLDLGGRIGFFGGTSALLNILRVYGGGGVHVLADVTNEDDPDIRLGLGGYVGIEAFIESDFSFYVEVGGQGSFVGGSQYGSGATVMGGMHFYL